MSVIHFLNVLEGDCNIIQHDSGRISMIDVSNAYNDKDTEEEKRVKASQERAAMRKRTQVPSDKVDYNQKENPDNPIDYLKSNIGTSNIFRFIITHPDMDHLDGIQDLYSEFTITNTWDTDNNEKKDLNTFFAGYNKEDWQFYVNLRDGKYTNTKRLTLYPFQDNQFWNEDNIKILCPTEELVKQANKNSEYHDSSYVLLFTPPKKGGGKWKFILAGDSHDNSWNYIIENHKDEVSNIDVLFAPHHGRDSNRSYEFLKTLNPKVTLFGNASSNHLAYSCYKPLRITNNQAGYVIMKVTEDALVFYVKNVEFAKAFTKKRGWGEPMYDNSLKAYGIIQYKAS
jgi:beta-lactamase superfamily II metal-dependent hydrolase